MAELTPEEQHALDLIRQASAEDLDALSDEERLKFKAVIDKASSLEGPTPKPVTPQQYPAGVPEVVQHAPEEAAYAAGAANVGAVGGAIAKYGGAALSGAGTPFTASAAGAGRFLQTGSPGEASKAFTESALETTQLKPLLEAEGVAVPTGQTAIAKAIEKAKSGGDLTLADKTGYYFEFIAPAVPIGSLVSAGRAGAAAARAGGTVGQIKAAFEASKPLGLLEKPLTTPVFTRENVISGLGRAISPLPSVASIEARGAARTAQAEEVAVQRALRGLRGKERRSLAVREAQRQKDLQDLESDLFSRASQTEAEGAAALGPNPELLPGAIADPAQADIAAKAEAFRQQAMATREQQRQAEFIGQQLQKVRDDNPELVSFADDALDQIRKSVSAPPPAPEKPNIFKSQKELAAERVKTQLATRENPFFESADSMAENAAFDIKEITNNPGAAYARNLLRTKEAPSRPPVVLPGNAPEELTSFRERPDLWQRTASHLKKWGLFIESNLKKTPSGTRLYQEVQDLNTSVAFAKATTQQLRRRWEQLIKTPEDTQAAIELAHGLPIDKALKYNKANVDEAVRLWKNADEALYKAAVGAGLDVGEKIPNHFRLKYRPDLLEGLQKRAPEILKAVIQNLVRDGLDPAAADKLINFRKASYREQFELFRALQSAGVEEVKTVEDAVRLLGNSDPVQRWALIKVAQGKMDKAEAAKVIQEVTDNGLGWRQRIDNSLERKRILNIPELADKTDFINNAAETLDRGWERILQVKKFGPNDELADALVSRYAREATQLDTPFPHGAWLGERYLNLALRRKPETQYLRFVRNVAATAQLPLAALGQTAGLVTTATAVRPRAFLEGVFKTARTKIGNLARYGGIETEMGLADRQFVESTAVLLDQMMPGIFMESASNVSGALSGRTVLDIVNNATGKVAEKTNILTRMADRIGKEIAVNAGASWGKQIFERLKSEGFTDRNAYAVQMLRDAGVNVEKALARGDLAERDLSAIGRMIAERTASQGAVKDLPLAFQSELGKTIFQYQGSVLNASKMYKQALVDQFKTGRLDDWAISMVTALVGAQAVGGTINAIRSKIYGTKQEKTVAEYIIDNLATVGAVMDYQGLVTSTATQLLGRPTHEDQGLGVPSLALAIRAKEAAARAPSFLLGDAAARQRFLKSLARTSPLFKIPLRVAGALEEKAPQ